MVLEKKIKFNNKDWLLQLYGNEFKVFLLNQNDEINNDFIFQGWESGKTLIDQCRNIIFKANELYFPIDELDDFQKWNGNMDKELNIK